MGSTNFAIYGALRRARAVAAFAGLCCCAPGCFGGGREPARLTSNNPGSKIPAITKAADECDPRDTETARHLVKSLESEDPAVRFYSIRGLQNLTGETFGYVWYGDDERTRRGAVERWKQWVGAREPGTVAEGDGRAD